MKDAQCYDSLLWEIRIEGDLWHHDMVYDIARHPAFGDISGPVGTGSSPEEALAKR
jgi:hypothetical protein